MNPRLLKQFLSALGAVALVSGCDLDSKVVQSDDRTAGGSDEIDTRIAVDRTGSPVVGARVALVKAGDSSGTALAVSATGSDGAYPTFVVPDGYYSLLVRDSSGVTGRYVDSVRVVSRKLPTGRDTLLSLGSVSGVVRLLSGDSPTSVRLGLVGTDILSSAKFDGSFKIELVPGGLYTLGAESSLDGYDRIYTRIQLKDGQNLTLADTLVLPYSGLPAPADLRVVQDTGTGNVSVKWNAVRNPDLLGYVLERVENGTVTESQFLTDTMWTDSLGAYWEALPLLGPWPDRNVTYRVRSRSASGAGDTKNIAQQLVAKPPMWTERDLSFHVEFLCDSSGYANMEWSPVSHPRVTGYVINVVVDSLFEYRLDNNRWDEAQGLSGRERVFDRFKDGNGGYDNVMDREEGKLKNISLSVVLESGVRGLLFDTVLAIKDKLIEWRDCGQLSDGSSGGLNRAGNWVLWSSSETGTGMLTKDGEVWEQIGMYGVASDWLSIPQSGEYQLYGYGDSLWLVNFSLHRGVTIKSRVAPGDWSSHFFAAESIEYVSHAYTTQNGVIFRGWVGDYASHSYVVSSVGLIENSTVDSFVYRRYYVSLDHWYQLGNPGGVVYYRSLNDTIKTWSLPDFLNGYTYCVGGMDDGAAIVLVYKSSKDKGTRLMVSLPGQAPILINSPNTSSAFRSEANQYVVFQNEIWAYLDGHLWKGKLNLPK